jgi:hypothetical protein
MHGFPIVAGNKNQCFSTKIFVASNYRETMHLRNNQIRFTKRLYKPIIDSNISVHDWRDFIRTLALVSHPGLI